MRSWRTLLVGVAIAIAGCADDTNDDTGDEAQTMDVADGNETVAPRAAETDSAGSNHAPTANLTADLLNGTAPLLVNFTLNGTDADGDNLTWILTVAAGVNGTQAANATGNGTGAANGTGNATQVANGTQIANGTSLPATFSYNFTEAGNFTVALFVSDGLAVSEAVLEIAVAEVTDPNAGLPEPLVWTGDTGSLGIICDPNGEGESAGSDGYHYFEPEELVDWKFEVKPSNGLRTSWWSGESDSESHGASGTVPSGRDNVGVCPSGDVNVVRGNVERTDYTMTLWHPDYVIEEDQHASVGK